ncbi:MAG: phosphatidylglycerophosphatase A [Phycisphaerales bacterium]|jgi:phosphatidylglycerophosphatase A|nr:phosphatidylglycerophosphatase A [Phycisphaerales bacterium]
MNGRLLLATAGGLGLLRPAPGTWGSLPPALLAAGLASLGEYAVVGVMAALLVGGTASSILLAPWYASYFGRTDPGEVVCDEVAGMSLALLLMPWAVDGADPWWPLAQSGIVFLAFRVFDITKPPPIGASQRLPRGWGVLVDDLLAGLAAAGVGWLVLLLT